MAVWPEKLSEYEECWDTEESWWQFKWGNTNVTEETWQTNVITATGNLATCISNINDA